MFACHQTGLAVARAWSCSRSEAEHTPVISRFELTRSTMRNGDTKLLNRPMLKTARLLLRQPDTGDIGSIMTIAGDWGMPCGRLDAALNRGTIRSRGSSLILIALDFRRSRVTLDFRTRRPCSMPRVASHRDHPGRAGQASSVPCLSRQSSPVRQAREDVPPDRHRPRLPRS